MVDDMKDKLREVISAQGQQVLDDPPKFTSFMLDLCLGSNKREINILATALTEKIPQQLLCSGNRSLTAVLRSTLCHRLQHETGLHTDAANWAINTWAEALGIAADESPETKSVKNGPSPIPIINPPTPPKLNPVIGLECKVLDFGRVAPGTSPTKTLQVRNIGAGRLTGKLSTSDPWIDISPQIIDTSDVAQDIILTVKSSALSAGKLSTGYINITSNGGPAKIKIKAKARAGAGEISIPKTGHLVAGQKSLWPKLLAVLAIACVIVIVGVLIFDMLKTPAVPPLTAAQSNGPSQAPATAVNQPENASENQTSSGQWLTVTTKLEPEPGDKKPVWQFNYRADYGQAGEPIVSANKVFFVTDGMIYCLDATNGHIIRKYAVPLNKASSTPNKQYYNYELIGIYKSQLLMLCDHTIYCLDSEKGTSLWNFENVSNPVLLDERLYFYSTALWRQGSFISIDVTTGNTLWKQCVWGKFREIKGNDIYPADIAVDNYREYFMYYDSTSNSLNIGAACLDKNSSELIWKNSSDIQGSDGAISSIISSIDKVVEAVCFHDAKGQQVQYICLDATTGKELWRTDKHDWFHRSMAMVKGKLITCHDESIICFNTDSGSIIWQYPYSGNGPFILNDKLLISNVGGINTCYFELNSGKLINQYGLFLYKSVIDNNNIFNNNGRSILCYDLN